MASVFFTLKEWVSTLATPVYATIRQWLCKLGLFKLVRPKIVSEGWFLIIDTSIQMGQQKFVLVLGVRKEQLTENFCPTHTQVEPIVLRPLETCPGEVIQDVLEEARSKVGIPLAIVSDAANELKRGIRLFRESCAVAERTDRVGTPITKKPIHLLDISHRIDICLKKELLSDPIWKAFQPWGIRLIPLPRESR